MKAALFDLNGNKAKTIELPEQFNEEFRPDIIMRSFLAAQSASRQPYGSYIRAGQRYSADISKRRRDFKTSYGHGISRAPRKTLWRRGTQFGWVGAFSPHTVGGRRAHPPRAYKILEREINKKEKILTLFSVLTDKAVSGQLVVMDDLALSAPKTKEFAARLKDLHAKIPQLGRSLLIIISDKQKPLVRAGKNLQDVTIVSGNSLNILQLLSAQGVVVMQDALAIIEQNYLKPTAAGKK